MKKITLVALALSLTACGSASLDGSATDSLSSATGTTPPPPSACEEQVSDLIAGQHIDAGSVGITNDGDSLIITYTADAPWLITEVHAWAGTGSPPTNNRGIVVPGHFPYAAAFNPGVSSYTIAIALADLDAECGEALKVVAHAVVKKTVGGVTESQTAFGDGTPFTGPRWGFTMGYDVCCDDGVCENHSPEEWTTQQWVGVSPDQHFCWNDEVGDGPSFGDIMASDSTDAFTLLVKEWITAKLNGSCTPWNGDVLGAMVAAHQLINDCEIQEDEAAAAAELTAYLAAYNAL